MMLNRKVASNAHVKALFKEVYKDINLMTPVVLHYRYQNYGDGTALMAEVSADKEMTLFGVTIIGISKDGALIKGYGVSGACHSMHSCDQLWINASGAEEEDSTKGPVAMPLWVQDKLGLSKESQAAAEALLRKEEQNEDRASN
jgi:hypothetical protein